MKALLDRKDGIETIYHQDQMTGEVGIENRQNVDKILDKNKYLQGEKLQDGQLGGLLARIPVVEYYRWFNEAGIRPEQYALMSMEEKMEFLRGKLNDPDYKYFRATTKHV